MPRRTKIRLHDHSLHPAAEALGWQGSRYSSEVPQLCNPGRTRSDPIRLSDLRMHLHRTVLPPVVVQDVSPTPPGSEVGGGPPRGLPR